MTAAQKLLKFKTDKYIASRQFMFDNYENTPIPSYQDVQVRSYIRKGVTVNGYSRKYSTIKHMRINHD